MKVKGGRSSVVRAADFSSADRQGANRCYQRATWLWGFDSRHPLWSFGSRGAASYRGSETQLLEVVDTEADREGVRRNRPRGEQARRLYWQAELEARLRADDRLRKSGSWQAEGAGVGGSGQRRHQTLELVEASRGALWLLDLPP